MRTGKKRTLLIVDAVLVCVLIGATIALAVTLAGYFRDRGSYADARAAAVWTPVPSAPVTPVPEAPAGAPESPAVPVVTPPIAVDFATIREEGRHVRAWLYSADTIISYPVVYYSNNEYYLTHDYTGARSNAGALFFDTRVSKELLGDNLIIYGHHMKDRSMFGSLLQYQKQAYYDEHPSMYLLTPDESWRVDLFAARFTDSQAQHFPVWFGSDAEKKAFVQAAAAESTFAPQDASYYPDKRIVTLATCAYSNYIEDAKYLVYGWLTELA